MPSEEPRKTPFDPKPHLIRVKGGQLYLEVRWRLIWLREEHPDASVEVELTHLDLDSKLAVARATVTLANGTKATEIGSETEKDFPAGWIEKASTKAIGRALAALGFGTQFALELDEGDGERIADSPVSVPASKNGGAAPAGTVTAPITPATAPKTEPGALLAAPARDVPASVPQDIPGLIRCIEAEAGVSIQGIFTLRDWRDLARTYGAPTPASNKDLTRAWMIDLLGHIHAGNGTQGTQGSQQQVAS